MVREELITKLREFRNDASNKVGNQCLTANSQSGEAWFQVTNDYLNISLPIKVKLFRPILKDLPVLASGMEVLDYKSNSYITFGIGELSQEQLVAYLMTYLERFYGTSLEFTWEIEEL